MRINKFVAQATGLSRRTADRVIEEGKVMVNGQLAAPGTDVNSPDVITLDGQPLALPSKALTVFLNKPAGYVVSRDGQGSRTVYDLLPAEMHRLKPVGRLDKDSSGLLLLTSDGDLANRLTHPSYAKEKVYEVTLNKALTAKDKTRVEAGVKLDDGESQLQIKHVKGKSFTVLMREGRNRQIRRTFETLGYNIKKLHRTQFGPYALGDLKQGAVTEDL